MDDLVARESELFPLSDFSEDSRGHLECGMNSSSVVVTDLLANGFHEFSGMSKAMNIAQLEFKVVVEGFLVPILPRRSFSTV